MRLLQAMGLSFSKSRDGLYFRVNELQLDVLRVRDDDIPGFVGEGVADLGVVGENVFQEEKLTCPEIGSVNISRNLGFAKCRLDLAVPEGFDYKSLQDLKKLRISTTYPSLLGEFMKKHGVPINIIEMHGSVEVSTRLGIADAICDIVATGSTLEANGLKTVETLLKSQAVLIQAPGNLNTEKEKTFGRFLNRLDGALASRETKYIMLNAPKNSLAKIKKLLPGAGAPTIIPLDGTNENFAVHAVCRESVFWETMENLKAAGASAILVVPIEKMMN